VTTELIRHKQLARSIASSAALISWRRDNNALKFAAPLIAEPAPPLIASMDSRAIQSRIAERQGSD
jgi:hypothetical protein